MSQRERQRRREERQREQRKQQPFSAGERRPILLTSEEDFSSPFAVRLLTEEAI